MAVDPATLSRIAYTVGDMVTLHANLALPVRTFEWNNVRCTPVVAAGSRNTMTISLVAAPQGDTVYLSYGEGEIRTVRLPSQANGPVCFITAGMSGCKLFVDDIVGSNDIIVSHANVMGVGVNELATESNELTLALQHQHAQARAYWTGPPHNLTLIPRVGFGRATYNAPAVTEEARKLAQNRTGVQFWGGTTVIGALLGAHWQLRWQTFGACTYSRPSNAPRGWFGNRDVRIGDLQHRILGHGILYSGA